MHQTLWFFGAPYPWQFVGKMENYFGGWGDFHFPGPGYLFATLSQKDIFAP
jgi:hypothetical protein